MSTPKSLIIILITNSIEHFKTKMLYENVKAIGPYHRNSKYNSF
jgi:hypothetical protein